MALFDRFGAPVSHIHQGDVDQFGEAAELMLGFAPDPVSIIKDLLTKSPDFIMARCFLAGVYLVASDKRRQPLLLKQFADLWIRKDAANDRERGHINAIKLWTEGRLYAASQAYADILNDFPRDIVALQFGHQTDFLLGHVSSTRDRPARMIGHWSEKDPQYSYILGMQAFGLEESGHYPQAQAMAERSVELNPKDTWGVHALAHCLEMQGKTDQGIKFMNDCEAHWGHDNYLSIHNRWHLSLYHTERCEFDQVLNLHDRHMKVTQKSELMDMHDSAALLWRLKLDDVDVGDRWEIVADKYGEVVDQAYMAFTDIHAMMAFAATNREAEANVQMAALENASKEKTPAGDIFRKVGLPLVQGFYAFGRGEYGRAKKLISETRHNSHLIGGSIAQRDVINLTLLEACIQDGDHQMAQALLAERTVMKPHSPLTNMIAKRAT
jgi:tetratricopeptide (TPR) repeat protein